MQDLAYALRDGVLLCHVASSFDPESVDQKNVNHRPQMAQFLCMKNIRIFLTACRDFFKLKETDLFQVLQTYFFWVYFIDLSECIDLCSICQF